MKPIIISLLLFCQAMVIAQITFEEITVPVDFSMYAVRKSPIGEYFVQAQNDQKSIYTSIDGIQWTKSLLPDAIRLGEIQFFSDGAPLLKSDDDEPLIRRNGNWYKLDMTGGFDAVKASCIKNDTLFAFQENTFGYSLDKGATFISLFTAADDIIDHTAHLWKFQDYLVLHHTAGASDNISVFNMAGQRVMFRQLASGIYSFRYNTCEQVLFTDYDQYYLLEEQGLQLTQDDIADFLPFQANVDELISANGNYYIRDGNTIYKSDGCQSSWAPFAQHDLVATSQSYWINEQEDIFLLEGGSNVFTEHKNGSATWDEHKPDINYPYVVNANEAGNKNQFILTPYTFYHKHVDESQWTKSDSLTGYYADIQYSPDGDVYVNADTVILYSEDNGVNFKSITIPDGIFPGIGFQMQLLDNDVILLFSGFGDIYYTLNNGESWINFLFIPTLNYNFKMVDNYIYFVDMEFNYKFYRVSILTHEVESVEFQNLYNFSGYPIAIQDDGTIYFYAWDPTNEFPEGIFRYRFGQGIEPLPELFSMAGRDLYSSGSDLFTFTRTSYDVYNGETLQTHPVSGLPQSNSIKFFVTKNEHLFVILNDNRIFRSTEPLSYPQYVAGTVYHDQPQDCIVATSDVALAFWQMKVENDHYIRISSTNTNGNFSFSIPKGDYTLSCQPVTSNWSLCEYSYPISIDDQQLTVNKDFLGIGIATCAELEIDFSTPRLRRCFENTYTIRVRNFGPEATTGTTLTLKLDPYFEFISSTLPYTLVNDSTVTIDLGILELNKNLTFQVVIKISCDAALGALHCLSGVLSDDNLCGLLRSSYTECQENIGSNDPNDKRIFNEEGNETTAIEKGEYIYYHIRFQNTGTDTAFTVRIVDQLSPMLDLSTLEMLSASHPYEYEITDGPALSVTFDNILLPDSTINEAASNGFLKFRVKPFPQFDYGTVIPNQAGIFFDFNAPVLTNQAELTIQHIVRTKEIQNQIQFDLFPNPTHSTLYLILPDKAADRLDAFEIIDALGRQLMTGKINGEEIDVANLSPGIYTIVLMEDRKQVGKKQFVRI